MVPERDAGRRHSTAATPGWSRPQRGTAEEDEAVAAATRGDRPYAPGDVVVYPHHGAGTIVHKEIAVLLGERREYLTIELRHGAMTVRLPTESAARAGLRRVMDEAVLERVIGVLRGGRTQMPASWSRRLRHNNAKIKTGDAVELAEVVRNLSIRGRDRLLSLRETQMLAQAKRILASELMYTRDMEEQEAGALLEGLLDERADDWPAPAPSSPVQQPRVTG